MAIKDIKGCPVKEGEFLACAHCGGGWARQITEHLKKLAEEGELVIEQLPCGGLQDSIRAALNLNARKS